VDNGFGETPLFIGAVVHLHGLLFWVYKLFNAYIYLNSFGLDE